MNPLTFTEHLSFSTGLLKFLHDKYPPAFPIPEKDYQSKDWYRMMLVKHLYRVTRKHPKLFSVGMIRLSVRYKIVPKSIRNVL